MSKKFLIITIAVGLLVAGYFLSKRNSHETQEFISYEIDLKKQDIQLYWRDDSAQLFTTIGKLKKAVERKGKRLIFAMNAGMFKNDYSPVGLFIQEGKMVTSLDTASGKGNFYLKPNGVFYVTKEKRAVVCRTEQFQNDATIRYATQSGPMLVMDGEVHPAFQRGSRNVNIRNGVGILANGHVIFAMSKKEINFYELAGYFKKMGCRNALYLDGFVSRTYLPEKNWMQTDGNLGVIIGVTE